MEETLISFVTAMLAKRKGFIYGSKSYYNGNDTLQTLSEEFHPNFRHKNNFKQRFRYEAAPQSILQKWLRDTYHIYIDIGTDCTTEPKFWYIIKQFIGDPKDLTKEEWHWNTILSKIEYSGYEEVLEIALQESLKLLENYD